MKTAILFLIISLAARADYGVIIMETTIQVFKEILECRVVENTERSPAMRFMASCNFNDKPFYGWGESAEHALEKLGQTVRMLNANGRRAASRSASTANGGFAG